MSSSPTTKKVLDTGHEASQCKYCGGWLVFLPRDGDKNKYAGVEPSSLKEGDKVYHYNQHEPHGRYCKGRIALTEAAKQLIPCGTCKQNQVPRSMGVCSSCERIIQDADLLKLYRRSIGVLTDYGEVAAEGLRIAVRGQFEKGKAERMARHRKRRDGLRDAQYRAK